ncbi:unnamed protein product, partial [Closterium sp. Naga37s-1]
GGAEGVRGGVGDARDGVGAGRGLRAGEDDRVRQRRHGDVIVSELCEPLGLHSRRPHHALPPAHAGSALQQSVGACPPRPRLPPPALSDSDWESPHRSCPLHHRPHAIAHPAVAGGQQVHRACSVHRLTPAPPHIPRARFERLSRAVPASLLPPHRPRPPEPRIDGPVWPATHSHHHPLLPHIPLCARQRHFRKLPRHHHNPLPPRVPGVGWEPPPLGLATSRPLSPHHPPSASTGQQRHFGRAASLPLRTHPTLRSTVFRGNLPSRRHKLRNQSEPFIHVLQPLLCVLLHVYLNQR